MRSPIYIGGDRAITFLPEDLPVIVDTRSIDSLNLFLGWPTEQDVIPFFKKLLTKKAVFVDVGANFGVYTAIALSKLRNSGVVFSFEANPRTYELLTWTIYANFGHDKPNVQSFNLAVSDHDNELVVLHSIPGRLGGTSLHLPVEGSEQLNVMTTTLDSALPDDVIPDIIKIDVEGHEPFVMRGCTRILDRSPHIVFIIELFDATLRHYGRERFVDELRKDYGLNIYVTGPGATLDVLPDGEYPKAECYILATRRSLDGMAEADYCVHPCDLTFPEEGPIFYGPYATIKRGQYRGSIRGGTIGEATIKFQGQYGGEVYGEERLAVGQTDFSFIVPEDTDTFELVASGPDRCPQFERIDLTRTAI